MLNPEEKLGMPLDSIIAAEGGAAGNRRVYVGNLSWSTAWQTLKDHMKQAGEVTRADVLQDAQGRSKGCGLVEFKTIQQAQNAIMMLNNTDLDGRQIFIREDREAASGNEPVLHPQPHSQPQVPMQTRLDPARQTCRVYVGNLSWNVDREQLRQHMSEAGEVVYAEVLTEPSGRSKGCGIVEYQASEQAQAAIASLHNTTLNGRPMFVREDREAGGGGGLAGPAQHTHTGALPMGMHMGHHPLAHPMMAQHHPHMLQPPQHSQGAQVLHPGPRMQPQQQPAGALGGAPRPVGSRVYVGNLSYEVAWQDLKDHMRKVGNVVHADVLEDHEGRSKGCGIVEYDNPHAAMRAIRELNNSELKGRLVFVREDREDRKMVGVGGGGGGGMGFAPGALGSPMMGGMVGPQGGGARGVPASAAGRQLFVSNLDFDVTWQDLKDHFKGFDVQRAEVAYDGEGRSKGFGTVRFSTPAEAQRALEMMNHSQLHSRQIELREDQRVA